MPPARTPDDDDDDDATPQKRPLWTGTISFGIVSIPVRMYPATRDRGLHFHQISRPDSRRIRYRKVAEGGDAEVPAEDIVKGYRLDDGRYVVFEPGELERLASRRSTHIEIDAFVDLTEVDPRHFERSYYLLPAGKTSIRPYQLLTKALARSNRTGIAKLVMHNKEHLVAVRALDDYLSLETMHFIDELVEPKSLGRLPATSVPPRELEMAEKLIDSMAIPFDARDYHDEYSTRLRQAIKRKAQGKTLQLEEEEKQEPEDEEKVLDLMEALQRSVARISGRSRGRGAAKGGSRTTPRKRTTGRPRHAG
jgi:DNA end-binding protein Ku